jgi:hypothetical protein
MEIIHKFWKIEDGEDRLPVNLEVVGLMKVLINDPVHNDRVVFLVDRAGPEQGVKIILYNGSSNFSLHRGWPT